MAYSNVAKEMREAALRLFPRDKKGRRAFMRLRMYERQQVVRMRSRLHGVSCSKCEDTGIVQSKDFMPNRSCSCVIGQQTWVAR